MIDIIRFKEKLFDLGFDKVLNISRFKIVEGGDSLEKNRALIEKRMDIFLSPEGKICKHSFDYANSGLNHVICRIAAEKGIGIGFSFSSLLNSKDTGLTLSQMKENIKLCRKYKTKIVIGSFANDSFEMRACRDLIVFGNVIGLSNKEAKEALSFLR